MTADLYSRTERDAARHEQRFHGQRRELPTLADIAEPVCCDGTGEVLISGDPRGDNYRLAPCWGCPNCEDAA